MFNELPALPVDDPLAPYALHMMHMVRLLFWLMAMWIFMKVILITYLIWDRRQQRNRDEERDRAEQRREDGIWADIRSLLTTQKGWQVVQVATAKQVAEEVITKIDENPIKTAEKVVEALAKTPSSGDSQVIKTI